MKREAIIAARAVICISESTRNDLLEYYPQIEDKVSIIYPASGLSASTSTGPEPIPTRPYFLYVGSREVSYKNFEGLLSAFTKVISANAEVALCVVGAPFNKDEYKLISDLKLESNIVHYEYASDDHLARLYQGSIAFVYPSLYEGFGIPPLEAMLCGTAVIASRCSSIPEVVGDAGLLFDPKSKEDLADSMLHLLSNPSDRQRLITKGYKRAKAFSWENTLRQTINVYCDISGRTNY